MTHAQASGGNCPGHIAEVDSFVDARLTVAGRVEQLVTVYRCDQCGRHVVVRRAIDQDTGTVSLAFKVSSEYGDPRELIQGLARSLTNPR